MKTTSNMRQPPVEEDPPMLKVETFKENPEENLRWLCSAQLVIE